VADVIGFVISAKNNASAVLNQVNRDISNLEKHSNNTNPLMKVAVGLGAVAASYAGLTILKETTDAIYEMGEAGANVERIAEGFNTLAASYGTSGTAIMRAIDSVTQGTLSQKTIMQQANNALLLGVADTADEFNTLAKIAQTRGRAMGISMEYAFESIVKGVGRLSPLILDNLGIVINADQTYARFAKTLGVTADQLTEAQKRQALLNALKVEVANWDASAVLDTAAAYEKWGVSVENAKYKLGAWLNEVLKIPEALNNASLQLDAFAGQIADPSGYDTQIATIRAYNAELQKAYAEQARIQSETNPVSKAIGELSLPYIEATIQRYTQIIAEANQKAGDLNQTTLELGRTQVLLGGSTMNAAQQMAWMDAQLALVSDQIERYAKAAGVSKDAAAAWAQGMIDSAGSAQAAIPMINQLVGSMEAAAERMASIQGLIKGAIGSLASIGAEAYRNSGYNPEVLTMIGDAEMATNAVYQNLYNSGVEGAQLNALMTEFTDNAYGGLTAINETANAINKASGGSGGGGVKQLTAEFQNLRGIIEGLFSGSLGDVGANVADFLPREDAVNEPARRIASVMVEGFDSEWVGYFKDTFPILWKDYMGRSGGDVKNAAALLLKDFQNGLRPELIDKEKMKEIAKRMFFVDQQTKQIIDDVAKELAAELGISVEEAKGYAGGASGSAAKKIVSQEEINKIKSMLTFQPTWNWGAVGGGSNPLIESGKAAGVLGEDGKFTVDVKFAVDCSELAICVGKTVNLTAKITTIDFDKPGLETFIATTFGPIGLTAKLFLLDTGLDDLKLSLSNTILDVSVVPVVNYTDWETYKTSATETLNAITFLPKAKSDTESMTLALADFKGAMANSLIEPTYWTSVTQYISGTFATKVAENNVLFSNIGLIVGAYMFSGFVAYGLGEKLAGEINRQLLEARTTFESGATTAGKSWGDSFLKTVGENVPFELLLILTDLITPEVIKRVKDKNSRGESE